jgi:DNA-binding response OmpR family regulator
MILLIEQDRLLGDLLVDHFKNKTDVVAVRSVAEGIEMVRTRLPQVLVIDSTMEHALELVRQTRATDTPIVAIDRHYGLQHLLNAISSYLDRDGVEILVVDDDPEVVALLEGAFPAWGFRSHVARTVADAIDIVKTNPPPALALVEVKLQAPGGLELVKRIQHITGDLKVIMMSSVADREIARRALDLGAFDYVLKPFSLDTLRADIIAALAHAEYEKQSWWKRLIRD